MCEKCSERKKRNPSKKNRNSVPIFRRRQLLKKMERTLEELSTLKQVSKGREANQELDALVPELLKQDSNQSQ
jgi:ribonuclease HI